MRYFISFLVLTMFLPASLLDFNYLKEAKQAYNDKNYTKAQENYAKVKSDEAKFNEADSLYRQKKYKEAIEAYQSIVEPKLEAKKLHNIGNSYANMNKIDEAIKSYEDALKLEDDKDTKFNLELLKKKKEEQKKKQDKKNDKENKNKKEDKKKQENKNDKNQENKKKNDDKNKKAYKEKKDYEKKKKEQEEKKQSQMNEQNKTQAPISNMEERKWQKMLNQRGVNTLMIPLNKGKKDNETNLW